MLSHMAGMSGRSRQRSAAAEFGLSLLSFSSAQDESLSHLRAHASHTVSALHTVCVSVCACVRVCVSKKSHGTEGSEVFFLVLIFFSIFFP